MNSQRGALVFVRNTVSYDARVLRAARLLGELGLETRVIGVLSTRERRRSSVEGGVDVVRLSPTSPFAVARRILRRAPGQTAAAPDSITAAGDVRSRPGPIIRAHRFLVTLDWYRRGLAEVARSRPALVHCNDWNTMWIGVGARLLGARVIYDTHELWPDRNGRREPRWWLLATEWLFVRVANAVVTTSPGYAETLARRYRTSTPVLVRNMPDRPAPVASAPAAGPPTAVYVGGLMDGRGLEEAIDALAEVPGLQLDLVGPAAPGAEARLRARAESRAVAERVRFAGAVPPSELLARVAGAYFGLVLIQPICLSYELTLPNKLLEYVAAGLPVLASDLPVIGEFVRTGGVGLVVHADDTGAIAAAMTRLADPAENAEMRRSAARVGSELTWAAEAPRLRAVYESLLDAA